jgi:hypothetical protein
MEMSTDQFKVHQEMSIDELKAYQEMMNYRQSQLHVILPKSIDKMRKSVKCDCYVRR